jgi:hypothetical protein
MDAMGGLRHSHLGFPRPVMESMCQNLGLVGEWGAFLGGLLRSYGFGVV